MSTSSGDGEGVVGTGGDHTPICQSGSSTPDGRHLYAKSKSSVDKEKERHDGNSN